VAIIIQQLYNKMLQNALYLNPTTAKDVSGGLPTFFRSS